MAGKNRFNNLTSKEWLPFQKSWFISENEDDVYEKNLRFFVKKDHEECEPVASFYGTPDKLKTIQEIAKKNGIQVIDGNGLNKNTKIQFALFDLRDKIKNIKSADDAKAFTQQILPKISEISENLIDRRFLAIFVSNIYIDNRMLPLAWDISEKVSQIFSLKDEKIGCFDHRDESSTSQYFETQNNFYYCQYFRKDENSGIDYGLYKNSDFYKNIEQQISGLQFDSKLGNWHIIKPARRTNKEILHPAKYPEEIVSLFISNFTKEGENVFDPMTGTASTQLAALKMGRNGYGTELSPFFSEIANERLENYIKPSQLSVFDEDKNHLNFKVLNKDARDISKSDFPSIDYIITSPPYWDMLNMAGAENQAKRKGKGLQTNYSDSEHDIGNISDYRVFLNTLVDVYVNMIKLLKPGGYFTIIVKNIKKQGKNYPFAYDLGHLLQDHLILLPEVFWVQDDINLAPYGYGNTFVSNTFHQYCLTFQKPI